VNEPWLTTSSASSGPVPHRTAWAWSEAESGPTHLALSRSRTVQKVSSVTKSKHPTELSEGQVRAAERRRTARKIASTMMAPMIEPMIPAGWKKPLAESFPKSR
jgi:hypothetical protein